MLALVLTHFEYKTIDASVFHESLLRTYLSSTPNHISWTIGGFDDDCDEIAKQAKVLSTQKKHWKLHTSWVSPEDALVLNSSQ